MKNNIYSVMVYDYDICMIVVEYLSGFKRYYDNRYLPKYYQIHETLPNTVKEFIANHAPQYFMGNKDIIIFS